ncbi:hypothetical protein BYT27DRAFT_7108149, partial [Phlegmacium glaucopus]
RLKEHVDEICHAWLGPKFPESGVGKQWTYQFVEKHSDRLHVYTTCPLDTLQVLVMPKFGSVWFSLVLQPFWRIK